MYILKLIHSTHLSLDDFMNNIWSFVNLKRIFYNLKRVLGF